MRTILQKLPKEEVREEVGLKDTPQKKWNQI